MIYLLLFIIGLGLILVIQYGKESTWHEWFATPKKTGHQNMDGHLTEEKPIVVYIHHGIHVQEELEFYVRSDGLILRDDVNQYHIPLRDIVRVTVDTPSKPIPAKSPLKRLLSKRWKEKAHYVVIGYKNAAMKLKVLTLHAPNMSKDTLNKLNSLI